MVVNWTRHCTTSLLTFGSLHTFNWFQDFHTPYLQLLVQLPNSSKHLNLKGVGGEVIPICTVVTTVTAVNWNAKLTDVINEYKGIYWCASTQLALVLQTAYDHECGPIWTLAYSHKPSSILEASEQAFGSLQSQAFVDTWSQWTSFQYVANKQCHMFQLQLPLDCWHYLSTGSFSPTKGRLQI